MLQVESEWLLYSMSLWIIWGWPNGILHNFDFLCPFESTNHENIKEVWNIVAKHNGLLNSSIDLKDSHKIR